MSTDLAARKAELKGAIAKRVQLMNRLESEAMPCAERPLGDEGKMDLWRMELEKNQRDNAELQKIAAEEARMASANVPKTEKTFVNSFGEATDRYVTSPAYERAAKEQERRVLSFLGGSRR